MEQRGDKLHYSSFVACMKHSKLGVMMQGKLGDCGGGAFFFSCLRSQFHTHARARLYFYLCETVIDMMDSLAPYPNLNHHN